MPSRVVRALPLSLLALLLAAPGTVGAPLAGGLLTGSGTASTFQIFSHGAGYALEGGAADWSLVCSDCLVRIALVSPTFVLAQDGAVSALPPGSYEIREFTGLLAIDQQAPHDYFVQIHGEGKVHAL